MVRGLYFYGLAECTQDPGVGEMFRFVVLVPGNRALFLRIALLPSQRCEEFSLACNSAWGYIAVAPAKVPTPKALTFLWGGRGGVFILILVPHYLR